MKAPCWHGRNDIRSGTAPDPIIERLRGLVVMVTRYGVRGFDPPPNRV